MPRPVCVRCNREMVWEKSVTVQFDAIAVGGAYQQWQGDLAKCPTCGAEIVARYGDKPSWEHHYGIAVTSQPDVIVPEIPVWPRTPSPETEAQAALRSVSDEERLAEAASPFRRERRTPRLVRVQVAPQRVELRFAASEAGVFPVRRKGNGGIGGYTVTASRARPVARASSELRSHRKRSGG